MTLVLDLPIPVFSNSTPGLGDYTPNLIKAFCLLAHDKKEPKYM